MILILLLKGSILCFCKNVLGQNKILTPWGMIPWRVIETNFSSNLPGVATPASQAYRVEYPGESVFRGSQQPFLYTFAQAFTETVAQK